MPSTSKVTIETVVTGLPEGGSARSAYSFVNSTATRVALETTVNTGISSATTVSNPVDARTMILIPPSTNKSPYRISQSTAEVGIPLSSQGFYVGSIPPSTTPSTYFLYTTGATAIVGLRVIFL